MLTKNSMDSRPPSVGFSSFLSLKQISSLACCMLSLDNWLLMLFASSLDPSSRFSVTCAEINMYCSLKSLSLATKLPNSSPEFLNLLSLDLKVSTISSSSCGLALCLREILCSSPNRRLSSLSRCGLASNFS